MADVLNGREAVIAFLTESLSELGGAGRALLVQGDSGMGKTAVLEAAAAEAAHAGGRRVLRVTGVECEAQLPFSGLHQLLHPLLSRVGQLAAPQQRALLTAFGTMDAEVPAIFLVGLAALNLLADTGSANPLVVVVDDLQWLDASTAEVLAFVSRRLESDPILLLAAIRSGFESPYSTAHPPDVVLEPLSATASADLLDARSPDLARVSREAILRQAAGNPLALVELPRALRSRLAGGEPVLPSSLPLTERLESAFSARAATLRPAARAALLVAALDEGVTLAEVLSAAARLVPEETGLDVLERAVEAGLITIDEPVIRFRHPLMRSALEQSAAVSARHEAHRALAEVLAGDADRHAWHRAASIVGTDEKAASELESAARRAQDRGATASAIAAQERAAALTIDHAIRVRRLLTAAEMAFELGQPEVVRRLVDTATGLQPSPLDQARITWLREIFDDGVPGDPVSVQRLVAASAEAAAGGDRSLALKLLHAAGLRCWWADPGPAPRQRVLLAVDRIADDPSAPDALEVMSLAAPVDRGAFVADAVARRAIETASDSATMRQLGMTAHAIGDFELALDLLSRAAPGLREQGRLGLLAQLLIVRAWDCIHIGKFAEARPDLAEGSRLAEETEQPIWVSGAKIANALLAGVQADEERAQVLAQEAEKALLPRRVSDLLAVVLLARGLTGLAAGRPRDAYDDLRRMFDAEDPYYNQLESFAAISYLAEAAVHGERRDQARDLLVDLEVLGSQTPAPILHAGLRYARAVLADEDAAENLYRTALEKSPRWPFDTARLQLAYGSWLRRRRRIAESRAPLRAARNAFDLLGAAAWGERARQELRAAGERSPVHSRSAVGRLSPQELQIAELAASGLSNREIGERLFLSHRTVSSHLYRVFPKLGIVSRSDLRTALGAEGPTAS